MRVWAAPGAAQLRAEVHLEPFCKGWRSSPWGLSQVMQPRAGWEQTGEEHVCRPQPLLHAGTDQTA